MSSLPAHRGRRRVHKCKAGCWRPRAGHSKQGMSVTCSPETGLNLLRNSRLGLAGAGQGNPRMKTSRFSEQQIAFILKQAEDGTTV
jgi:hypothetical protein